MLVDVVVRDKRGQPVRDLALSDFEVLEDGVPQTIGSFTSRVLRAGRVSTGGSACPRRIESSHGPGTGLISARQQRTGRDGARVRSAQP